MDTAALRLAAGWDFPADDANGTRRSNIVYSSDVDTSNGIHITNASTHGMLTNGDIRGGGGGRGGRGSKRGADDSDLRYDQVKNSLYNSLIYIILFHSHSISFTIRGVAKYSH